MIITTSTTFKAPINQRYQLSPNIFLRLKFPKIEPLVRIISNGKVYNAHFDGFEEACEHAEVMAVKLHGEFVRRR